MKTARGYFLRVNYQPIGFLLTASTVVHHAQLAKMVTHLSMFQFADCVDHQMEMPSGLQT
jgi:hypothetical protein